MIKRAVSFLLALLLVVSAVPVMANAAVGDNIVTEAESNNSTTYADRIYDDDTVNGTLSTSSDKDFFRFTLSATSMVELLFVVQSGGADISINSSSTTKIAIATYEGQSNNGYATYSLLQTLPAGTYYVLITGSTYNAYSNIYTFYFTTNHKHDHTSTTTEPTCSSQGYTTHTCYCGDSYVDSYTNPLAHTYDNAEDATCNVCGYNRVNVGWVVEDGKQVYYKDGFKVTNNWIQGTQGWYYLDANGHIVTNDWKQDSNGWCYLGADGYMVINNWVQDSQGWCYLGSDGYCVTNSWMKDSKGWCYLDANGRMVYSKWVSDSKGWCYVGSNGYMVTSAWVQDSNGWCYLGADGYCVTNSWMKDSKGWCYLDANGRMVTNDWVRDSQGWCYVDANGYCVTDSWMQDSQGWCYLDANGRMVYNQWVSDSKGWCYVGSNGYMVTKGWAKDNRGWCYIGENGYMVKNTWVEDGDNWYFIDANGYMMSRTWKQDGGEWYYLGSSGAMLKNDWLQEGGYWYSFKSDGTMRKGCYSSIDGALYSFNSDGKMKANQSFNSGYIGADGKIGPDCYAYLAASDYRSEQRKYTYAVARAGYVNADVKQGALWVVTIIYYRIGTYEYKIETLHDLTNNLTITSPADYYDNLADRYFGATKIKYLGYASDVLSMQVAALTKGYISPSYLMK